jgi:hypothetical protein
MEEPKVILGHPILRAPGDVSLDEVMGMAHWAVNQAQGVLRWERGHINNVCRQLLLWASMHKEWTTPKKTRANARQRHLDMREELLERQRSAIDELDTTSHEMLSNAKELYTLAEARSNTTIKQEEELIVRIHAMDERERAVEELEQKL